ncbi:sodium-dependent transporter [Limibacter armeniacum]|uniref:sodium-dependent transporter n=1 Tax=Limibacter armeniacum TaxID=466084 RepID=UPI002FE60E48
MATTSRGGFSNRLGFILAAAGSAVGLGNIWKFPFEVSDGGGAAFVVMYLLFCFILCFPVMVTEIAIGRHTSKNAVGAFHKLKTPRWSIIGKLGILSGTLILSFYNVVAGWTFGYAIEIIQGNFEIGGHFGDFVADWKYTGAFAVIFAVVTAVIVQKGVSSGIEKASKILMPTLLVLILSLMCYSLTREGALEGVKYYLIPDFTKIKLDTIYGALGQAFFSLSLGMGALITYGSYVGKNDNIITSATWITLMDVGIAFIAGLMMFSFIFSQGLGGQGGGAGLIFQVLPGAFESLGPILGRVIGGTFFILLSFAALTSTVSLLEVPTAYVIDEFGIKRNKAVVIVASIIFAVGIPSLLSNGATEFFSSFVTYFGADQATSFMTLVEDTASDTMLPLGGTLISIYGAYIWKKKNLYAELTEGNTNFRYTLMAKYIDFALRFLCPIVLGFIFVLTVLSKFFGIVLI